MITTIKRLDDLTGSGDIDISRNAQSINLYFTTKFMVLLGT